MPVEVSCLRVVYEILTRAKVQWSLRDTRQITDVQVKL
jgi:hypothetical protein